jgi:hypothetical protein
VLVGAFYWRDFFAIWQTTISTGWIIFTFTILFLVLVFIFQRRDALKTLVLISENHNSGGAGFVLLALVLHIVGSYTPYALWLHFCSLVLFIAGYLTLVVDFRIPRLLFLPLVALVFVAPPFGMEVFEVQNLLALVILYLSVNVVIVALVTCIVSSSKWLRMKAVGFFRESSRNNETKGVYCPLCRSDMFKKEAFCFHCGRQRVPLKLKPFKPAFIKFLVLLLIVLILSFAYLPTFSLADQGASLISYTPHGIEEQTIIPTPEGWKLEYSERLVDYERERLEDFAMVATYIWGEFSENKSYIQLEIGSGTLYMRNGWRLPGWQRSRQEITLTKRITGQYVVLQKGDTSITVLYWTMRLMFRVGSVSSARNVGVSVFSKFTEPITELKVAKVLDEFRRVGISIIDWWDFVSRWMLHVYTLRWIYVNFRDAFFTVVGVVAVFVSAGWIRTEDEKVDRLTENAFALMEDEPTLLVTISEMKRRRFLGKELFDAYRQIEKSKVDLKEFYARLRKFSMRGLIKKDYVPKNGKLVMIWKRMFP